jgi:Cu/Ag efflux pump CusA
MPKFALRYPFFIIMLCLVVMLIGVVNIASMPVDLFPKIDMPVVVVATSYNGMPPQQIEADITNTFERFFTLGANIDHSESRSLTGVSLIKIYFKPGTDPNAALSNIANLAMADLRRLPPGTLPPVVLGMDPSSQPVCLVTLEGKGNNYMVSVQYANRVLNHTTMEDFENIPLRGTRPQGYDPMQEGREASDVGGNLFYGGHTAGYTPLRSVAEIKHVNLSQSHLLQLDAQNNAEATMAALDTVLGLDHEVTYQLIDDSTQNSVPPPDFDPLIQTALKQRPDLQSLTFGEQSAQKFAAHNGTSVCPPSRQPAR